MRFYEGPGVFGARAAAFNGLQTADGGTVRQERVTQEPGPRERASADVLPATVVFLPAASSVPAQKHGL